MAKIVLKTATDKALILGVRQAFIYPFSAPDWTDLRLGVFLSVTKAAVDDDVTGLTESLPYATVADRFFLGIKNNNDTLPGNAGANFIGFSGLKSGPWTASESSPNNAYWYFQNSNASDVRVTAEIGATLFTELNFGNWLRLPNSNSIGAGYAALLCLKFSRAAGSTNVGAGSAAQAVYSSTPTVDEIRAGLSPAYIVGGAQDFSSGMADALFFYWPFNNSRLRIHSLVLEKFA